MFRSSRALVRALHPLTRSHGAEQPHHCRWLASAPLPPAVPVLIGGELRQSTATQFVDVKDPATGVVVARTPLCTGEELKAAVEAASRAAPGWRTTSVAVS